MWCAGMLRSVDDDGVVLSGGERETVTETERDRESGKEDENGGFEGLGFGASVS